ncbi:cell division protein FtsW [Candidatus Saccharibacteria bacterium]|nr:cell division protein FtsW [Candidatus Saccharibacteria bacterium]
MNVMSNRPRRSSVSPSNISKRRHKPDYWLIIFPSALLVVGLIVVYSISPGLAAQKGVTENYYASKQLIAVLLGITSFIIASQIPIQKWKNYRRTLIILSVVASLAVLLFGDKVNGAYRWIQIGGFSFQAVELIKFTILIWLASFLYDRWQNGEINNSNKTLKPLLLLLLIVTLVVANPKIQSDLGSTGVIVAMMAGMSFVACLPFKRIMLIALIVITGTTILVASSSYRRDRLQTFIQPQRDCQNTGYQSCQALIAVGSGGLFGKGLAHSVQAYGYLPEAANDSIFAIYAEKFGFIGVSVIMIAFAVFFTRIKYVIERAPDVYTRLIAAGVLAWLSTQAIINIGAMIGLLPLKGITLPFISYGGTSIIFVMAAIGIVFNISRYTTYTANTDLEKIEGKKIEGSTDRRRDRRTYYATTSRRT